MKLGGDGPTSPSLPTTASWPAGIRSSRPASCGIARDPSSPRLSRMATKDGTAKQLRIMRWQQGGSEEDLVGLLASLSSRSQGDEVTVVITGELRSGSRMSATGSVMVNHGVSMGDQPAADPPSPSPPISQACIGTIAAGSVMRLTWMVGRMPVELGSGLSGGAVSRHHPHFQDAGIGEPLSVLPGFAKTALAHRCAVGAGLFSISRLCGTLNYLPPPLQPDGEAHYVRPPASIGARQFRIEASPTLSCEAGAVLDAEGEWARLTIAAALT